MSLVKPGHEAAFFELLFRARGLGPDGKPAALEYSDRIDAVRSVQKVLHHFVHNEEKKIAVMHEAVKERLTALRLRHFTTSDDLPELITNVTQAFTSGKYVDMGWEQAFQRVTVDDDREYFEIPVITDGMDVQKVPEGGRLRVEGVTGTVARVYLDKFGAAFGWTDEMIRYRRMGSMIQLAQLFQTNIFADKADRMYSLMTLAANANVDAYDATGANELEKDINSLNKSANALADANKAKGYGDTANMPFILFAKPLMKSRILRAIKTVGNEFAGAQERLAWDIVPIFTFNSNMPSGNFNAILCLPGRRAQYGVAMEPTNYSDSDPFSLSYYQTVWTFWGAGIDDTDQFRKMSFN